MKKILIILCLIYSISNYSQISIQLEKQINEYPWGELGVYYKDFNNVLEPFVGTYLYSNTATNSSFQIILQKKLHSDFGGFNQDMLIGAYKYIENGITKVDALNDITINYPSNRSHVINGYMILTGTELGCYDCSEDEIRIHGMIKDPVSGSVDTLIIRKVIVSGQEALKIFILHSISYKPAGSAPAISISYPLSEEITLLKI